MWSVQERFGHCARDIRPHLGYRLLRRDHQTRDTEAYRLRRRGMFVRVIEGLIRFIVVNGTVVLVMVVLDAFFVL